MKNGIFIVIEENDKLIAAIKRADSQVIRLDNLVVTDAIKALNGKKCEYLPKTTTVLVDGKNIYEIKSVSIPVSTPIKKESRTKLTDSFNLLKTWVPEDVCCIKALKFDNLTANFALKLNKFARFDFKDNKGEEHKFTFFNAKPITKVGQKEILVPAFEIHDNNYGLGNETQANEWFNQFKKRHFKNAEAICLNLLNEVTFVPAWRIIIGLGTDSVYETGITLHHIYGFPYIPASSIKGVLRNYIINECFDLNENERKTFKEVDWSKEKEEKALKCTNFKIIFGSQKDKGNVIFFDAFPTAAPKIVVDIMTPHYGDYYKTGSTTPPTDTQSPNPIPFLTVEDTPFQFMVGLKKGKTDFDIEIGKYKGKALEQVGQILKDALMEHGIGAKTAVGYGYMKS